MTWYDIRDPQDPELDRLAALYQLHPLHTEDCRHRNQSAKIEEFNGYVFIVLKPMKLNPDGELDIDDLDIFFGPGFLITVQEDGGRTTGALIDHIRANWGSLRQDQLLYRIADGIVDSYLPCLDAFGDAIDELEDRVLDKPTPEALQKIFETKRGLVQLRRVLVNTRDVMGHLQRIESDLIGRDMWPFLRDVYDHVARNLDLVETQRDLLNGTLDIYLSSVANRTNQVMKVLTVLGTIALPAIIVSSIYGMNIEGLPWRTSPHAAIIIGAVMAAVTAVLLLVLRAFRWF
jgi:magnesium transporter